MLTTCGSPPVSLSLEGSVVSFADQVRNRFANVDMAVIVHVNKKCPARKIVCTDLPPFHRDRVVYRRITNQNWLIADGL